VAQPAGFNAKAGSMRDRDATHRRRHEKGHINVGTAHTIALLTAGREQLYTAIHAIDSAIRTLEKSASHGATHVQQPYDGIGIVDASTRWLREVGQPRSTREIADALLDRGFATRSKNFVATVYSTLYNSRRFERTLDGQWEILEVTESAA